MAQIKLKCINKTRDNKNKIISYRLAVKDYDKIVVMTPEELKAKLLSKEVSVVNLKLTSDMRLIDIGGNGLNILANRKNKKTTENINNVYSGISDIAIKLKLVGADRVTTNRKVFEYLVEKDSNIEKILRLHNGEIKYKDSEAALQNPKYSVFVTSMERLFYNYHGREIDISKFDTHNVVDMRHMFMSCTYTKYINLETLNTDKVTNMEAMFGYCENLETLNLNSFNTSNVITMSKMFENCYRIKRIDLKYFDTSNVETFSEMFLHCQELRKIDLSNFIACTGLISTQAMFSNCHELRQLDLSSFKISSKVNASSMFFNCKSLRQPGFKLNETFENLQPSNYTNNMFALCDKSVRPLWYTDN